MTRRNPRSISPRVRFDVFTRDCFTCQYCGGRPPEIRLVVDHIRPVARGGSAGHANLVTACEPCNQGKAANEVRVGAPSPGVALYLQEQEDAALFRRVADAAFKVPRSIRAQWRPNSRVIWMLLDRYSVPAVEAAVWSTSLAINKGWQEISSIQELYTYMAAEAQAEEQALAEGRITLSALGLQLAAPRDEATA